MQRVALRARRLARIQAQCAKAAGTSSSKYYTEAAVLHRLERTLTLAVTLTLTLPLPLTLTLTLTLTLALALTLTRSSSRSLSWAPS